MKSRRATFSQVREQVTFLLLLTLLTGLAQAVTGYKVSQVNPTGSTSTVAVGLNKTGTVVGNFTNASGAVLGFKFAANHYSNIKFPNSNNFTRANGINDTNLIVGDFFGKDNFYHGFMLSNGTYTQYDVNKGVVSTSIFGVNNNGDFVGAAGAGGPNQGFVNVGGVVTEFYGTGTDNTFALGINSTDQVVGQYFDASNLSHGFSRTSGGSITEVIYPGALQTACLGITDAGIITGWYEDSLSQFHGFTDTAGVFQTLPFGQISVMNAGGSFVGYYVGPGKAGGENYGYVASPHVLRSLATVTVHNATSTSTFGLSNAGVIVGQYTNSGGTHGMKLSGSTVTNIDDPKALTGTTACYGINTANQIVGFYVNSSNATQAFLFSGTTYTDVGPAGSTNSLAATINDSGVMAGYYFDSGGVEHAFTYNGSAYTTIDVPGAVATASWGINAVGKVTLQWVDANGFVEGSLYDGSTFSPINVPGATHSYPHAINKNGNIVFSWQDFNDNFHGAILSAGAYYIFDDPNGTGARADGLNDSNLMVGRFNPTGSSNFDGFKGML